MNNADYLDQAGPFESRYLAFLETITQFRPSLHRYCARMTGSVMDGEDVVQEALFEAYRKLDKFDDSRPLKPWLFRIAHNRGIDFLRKHGVRIEAETAARIPDTVEPANPQVLGLTSQGACLHPLEGSFRLLARGNRGTGGLNDRCVKAALNRAEQSCPLLPLHQIPVEAQTRNW